MAAARGETGGRWDRGARGGWWRANVSAFPHLLAAEHPRPSSCAGARLRRRASGVCVEPLPAGSAPALVRAARSSQPATAAAFPAADSARGSSAASDRAFLHELVVGRNRIQTCPGCGGPGEGPGSRSRLHPPHPAGGRLFPDPAGVTAAAVSSAPPALGWMLRGLRARSGCRA